MRVLDALRGGRSDLVERTSRGSLDDGPVGPEARAVAGAVPRLVGAVPVHDAAEVSAPSGERMKAPLVVLVDGGLARAVADDPALATIERPHRATLEAVADEAHPDIGVLLDELGR